ncbi:ethylene-responsive transcription factor-like protein At4g13040 isoform X2 [Nymphaea colorata]|uniref:ethylene-responsive transcription factor-like protein At4g13040 isoform X2 n=1 Tax=Nymphaea colorata TaxID=210225 RepID=UPI00129D3A06|nr:ethylene-responsive transcription factor-like protein At4g13040 isoform X2 [Nymphaea colorata]
MVSIRRRKHLGMGPGNNTYLVQLPRYNEITNDSGDPAKSIKSFDNSSTPSIDLSQKKEITLLEACPGSSNVSGCSSSKEKHNHRSSLNSINQGAEIKRRKRQRRKYFEDQEPCVMRGVYFKNMKWQAAIKVDKKQIHLGTVGSQEEAAHLYDRAAFMCGREPNFELPEEEKKELRTFDWEGFLAMTRSAITNKKHQKRVEAGRRKRTSSQTNSVDNKPNQVVVGLAASEVEGETSNS